MDAKDEVDDAAGRQDEAKREQGAKSADAGGESGSDQSDSDSDSDDSSVDVDVDAETAQQVMALEHELKTHPTYEKHLEYITLLRATPGLRARLREAHAAFAAAFPLSEELWLAAVNDELGGVRGPEDVDALLGLLRTAATRDYLAPGVWELYLEVAHDLDPGVRDHEAEGAERYRALCEEALAAAGLHLGAGHRLWEKYRKYELAVESKLAAAAGGGGGKGSGAAAASKQQDRVRALYQRQLQVPLQDVAATLEEYKAWEAGHGKSVPAHVAKAADKAREAAELRSGCEAAVAPELPADVAKLGAFMAYIKMEQNAGDAARVQVVYERAVAAFPLTHSLWLQYGQYMETHTKLPGPIRGVYGRAVRNCPWVAAVWEAAIRCLDRTGASVQEVDEMYDNALKAGLQSPEDHLGVILARLDFLRRQAAAAAGGGARGASASAASARLRDGFRSASEVMLSSFPDHVDRALRLPAYWAHCEEHVVGDVAAAREVWEGAVKSGVGRYADVWEAYIGMERAARRVKEARALYKRCYSRRFEEDGQLRLCHAWLRFEREEGSADDYLQALLKVEPILEESAAVAAAAADQVAAAAAKAAVQKAKNLSKEEMKALRQSKDPNFKKSKDKDKAEKAEKTGKGGKRGRQDGALDASTADGDVEAAAASKRVRTTEPEPASAPAHATEAQQDAAAEHHDTDADMADQEKPAGGAREEERPAEGEEEGHEAAAGPGLSAKAQAGARPHYTDQMTVFIKGLRMGLKDADLGAFLREHVPEGVKEIRVMRDHQTGATRGFAYVECSSREALDKVVALNSTTFQGKPLFIAESKPPGPSTGGPGGRGPGGRFQAGRGRFSAPPGGRGGFTGRGRGGRGRGGGTDGDGDAEMEDAGEAGGEAHGGRGGGRGAGGGGRHAGLGHPGGRHGMRTHLQVSGGTAPTALVPRSVQLGGGADASGAGEKGGQPLSNEDFRKMLFGAKK